MNESVYRILGKRGRITIPYEIRKRVGFGKNDILSFTESEDGNTVTVKRETVCDNCRGKRSQGASDDVTLADFLDHLSPQEQRSALIHLTLNWASLNKEGRNV